MTTLAVKLLSCREVDRIYRLTKGTAAAAYRAKKIKGRPSGKAIYLSAKRAEEIWGIA